MSNNVEERIVQMQFDNKRFETNVATSIHSLEALKQSLNLDESAKSLTNLEKVARGFSIATISDGVEAVTVKFNALGIIGVTALQNITNSAINMGKQLVSSLTVDQVTAGFAKYEDKTKSVQTIMNSTGKSIEEVSEQLDKLNWFTDETSYNFTDMVSNIGKFTAMNVELDTSVTAMQGIATWAAISGQGANEASRAMYNLSQAIGVGAVKLMDWKSIENANMATAEFKEVVIQTAKELGTLTDSGKTAKGNMVDLANFSSTLSDEWFTSDVLLAALDQYGGYANEVFKVATEQGLTCAEAMKLVSTETMDLGARAFKAAQEAKTFTDALDATKDAVSTGWMSSFEIIFGNYQEAKVLWTDLANVLYDVFAASAEARNEMLQGWKDLGGRDALIESVANAFNGLMSVVEPISEAFSEIFPAMTSERLFELTEGLRTLTENFKMNETDAENLKRTFKGLFAILDIGRNALSSFLSAVGSIVGYVAPAGSGLLSFTASIGDWAVGVNDAVKAGDIFNRMFQRIGEIVKPIADGVSDALSTVVDSIKAFRDVDLSGLDSIADRVQARFAPFGALGGIVSGFFTGVIDVLKKAAPVFTSLGTIVATAVRNFTGALGEMNFKKVGDIFNTGVMASILVGINKFIGTANELKNVGGFIDSIVESITGLFDGVKGSIEAFQSSLKAGTLMKIATAIAVLAASLVVLSLIDSNKLAGALGAISVLFIELFASMSVFETIMSSKGFKSIGKITAAMVPLSVAILILATALTKLAKLDWDQLAIGLTGVGALMGGLTASAKVLSTSSASLIKGSAGLIVFAAAIRILVGAVEELGALDPESLTKGLIGVGVLCAELVIFLRSTDMSGMSISTGIGLIALAGAINILAIAVKTFSEFDTAGLIQGLSAVGVLLGELIIFTKATGDSSKVISTAIGMTILGAAMLIFAEAVTRMGSLPIEQIGKGLLAMSGALTAAVVALNLMPKNMLGMGVGLIAVSTAMVILSQALKTMGEMTGAEIGKSLITLAGAMTILAVAVNAMTGALGGAAAIFVVASALAILTPVLKTLGKMSLGEIATGLIALAGVFAVIGVAGAVLAPLTPTLLGLAAAVALFGVAVLAVGAGTLAFATGLTAIAVAGTGAVAAIVLIVTSLVGLIPMVIEQIGYAIVALAGVISAGAPAIAEAVIAVLMAIITTIDTVAPELIVTVVELIGLFLSTVAEHLPDILEAGISIILGLVAGISDHIGEVVAAAVMVVLRFVAGVIGQIPIIVQAAFDIIIAFIDGLAEALEVNAPRLIESVIGLGGSIIQGLLDGLLAGLGEVGETVMELGKTVIDAFCKVLGINSPSKEFKRLGEYTSEGFVRGVSGENGAVTSAVFEMGDQVVSAMSTIPPLFEDIGKNAIDYFLIGVTSQTVDIMDAGVNVVAVLEKAMMSKTNDLKMTSGKVMTAIITSAKSVLLDINSGAEFIGKSFVEGVAEGISKNSLTAKNAANNLALGLVAEMKGVLSIHSPSKVTRNEVGVYIVQGIAEGITADMSAEDAAAKKANNIVNAFKEALDKVSLDTTTAELENKLWTALNPEASDAERTEQEMLLLTQKIDLQREKTELAQAEYKSMIDNLGVDSEETQEAYNKYLQEQIVYAEFATTLTEQQKLATKAAAEEARQLALARHEYLLYMNENSKKLQDLGFSLEDVEQHAREQTNYDPDKMAKTMEKDVGSAVETALNTVEIVYEDKAPNTFGGLLNSFGEYGTSYASTLGEGFITEFQSVLANVRELLTDFEIELDERLRKMAEAMQAMGMDVNYKPIISPVVDMGKSGSSRVITSGVVYQKTTASLSASVSRNSSGGGSGGVSGNSTNETSVTFNQYNSSPKAISAVDIYRQTKNGLSALKTAVNKT